MNLITSFFLRAKHWQIFFLVFGVYLVGQLSLLGSILASARSQEVFAKGGLLGGLVMTLSTLGLFVWFWSMGSFFNSIVKPELRLKSEFFRVALIYPPFYFVFFIATFQSSSPGLLGVILPLHLFAMFCMFYLLYFVSKSLVSAETSKPASFYDYAGPFFLLWFFPVGIWIVQPRVNRLYGQAAPSPLEVGPGPPPLAVTVPMPATGSDACGVSSEAPAVYAGFWLRVAAVLIDCVAMFIPFCIIAFIVILMTRLVSTAKGYDPGGMILAVLPAVTILAAWFYFAVLESSPWQATLGKKAVGLYVCDIEGHRLTFGRAIGRNLAKCLSTLSVGIGYMMCGFTKKKQALHDMIASCLVLRRP